MKSGFVALVGKPNVGKSSIVNSLVGAKVCIVSDKPQTTRNRIAAIANLPDAQVVFLDTPGIHRARHNLGDRLVRSARSAMEEVDLIVFVADAASSGRPDDQTVASYIAQAQTPAWLLVNKIDLVGPEQLAEAEAVSRRLAQFERVRLVSAVTGCNLDGLVEEIASVMPDGPMYYPPDVAVDRPDEFLAAELVREKLLLLTREEVPHSVAVVIDRMQRREDRDIVDIDAVVLVERESHKGIVIGAGGRVLKQAGMMARSEIERLLGSQVNLQLWVKVRRRWRDDDSMLDRLGFRDY